MTVSVHRSLKSIKCPVRSCIAQKINTHDYMCYRHWCMIPEELREELGYAWTPERKRPLETVWRDCLNSVPGHQVDFRRKWFNRGVGWWKNIVAMYQTDTDPPEMKPVRYLEIGVFEGRSAHWMMMNLLTHPDSEYVGIDNWTDQKGKDATGEKNKARAEFNTKDFPIKRSFIEGDSTTMTDQLVAESSNSFDVVYVDGLHTYAAVLIDAANAFEICKPGGVIAFDDYRTKGVRRAIHKVLRDDRYKGRWKQIHGGRQLGIVKEPK